MIMLIMVSTPCSLGMKYTLILRKCTLKSIALIMPK